MFSIPSVRLGLSMTRKTETLEELKQEFKDATNHLDDENLDKEERHDLKNTISYLMKRISDLAEKSAVNQSPSQFFNPPNAPNAPNPSNTAAPVVNSSNISVQTTTTNNPGATTNLPPPIMPSNTNASANVFSTPINATPTNNVNPQPTAPLSTPSGRQPKYVYDAKNFRVGAVKACRSGTVLMSRKDRENHDDKHRRKFHLEFIAGIPKGQGFRNIHVEHLLSTKDNEGAILAAVDILGINECLEQKFRQSDSEDMFCIRIFGPSGNPNDIVDYKNVFFDWMILTPELILKSCDYITAYTDDETWDDDLMWSTETILNWIKDEVLHKKVEASLNLYEESQKVGPLTLFITLHEIAYCDTATLDNLLAGLAQLRVGSFPAEDMHQHASVWRQMLLFFQSFNKIPTNAVTLLLDQYHACSVPEFRLHFAMLKSIDDIRLNSVETILRKGIKTQHRLQTEKVWHPMTKAGSVFLGAQQCTEKGEGKEERASYA